MECGRRSGKTEHAKRDGVEDWNLACGRTGLADYFIGYYAPTRDHAKAIYWEDLKALCPDWRVAKISETDLSIQHVHGPTINVIGMDKPHRAVGRPVDMAYCDEFADWKPMAWQRDLRPALDTDGRPGRAWLYGVPRPSAAFQEIADIAKADTTGEWDYFTWQSADILTAEAIESAKRDLDDRLFAQEYEARRVPFSGRIYYAFDRSIHVKPTTYDPDAPLILCLDFNVEPGAAVVCQEKQDPTLGNVTHVLGEVHIKRDSNTPMVCAKFLQDWGAHKGEVYYYGDPTGGNRGTAKLAGNDWELVRGALRTVFAGRLYDRVDRKLKDPRLRINALNSRFKNAAGEVRCYVDPKCRELISDFDNVCVLEGSAGEIDKKKDLKRTHWSDAAGYYFEQRYSVADRSITVESL